MLDIKFEAKLSFLKNEESMALKWPLIKTFAMETASAYQSAQSASSTGLSPLDIQHQRKNLTLSMNLNASSAELAKFNVLLKP
jgi:hypothetical protein